MRLLVDLSVIFFALCAVTSGGVGLAHRLLARPIDAWRPSRRAKARVMCLFLPALVGLLGVLATLLPSVLHFFGLADDHCLIVSDHAHAHLCLLHRPADGSPILTAIVGAIALVTLARAAITLRRFQLGQAAFSSLISTSASVQPLGERVSRFECSIPICVTAGLLRPRVYVSTSALAALGPECTAAALAHEHAHIARHETRLRFFASFVELLHVPPFGHELAAAWEQDSEFVCDQYAARSAGSPTLVAEALVRFQRALVASAAVPMTSAVGLLSPKVFLQSRVTSLLHSEPISPRDSDGNLASFLGFGILILIVGLEATYLHHALESLLGSIAAWLA